MDLNLDRLPGIDYWGARRIDGAISKDAIGGALLGVLVGAPLLRVPAFVASTARHSWGWPAGHVVWILGWAASAYLALLAIAHWKQLDEETDG